MGWYPCCCSGVCGVLYWGADGAPEPTTLSQIYQNIGVPFHTHNDWTGILSDYRLIYFPAAATDPSWWGLILGNDWSGLLVLTADGAPFGGSEIVDYVNSYSWLTGISIIGDDIGHPSAGENVDGSVESHDLTDDMTIFRYTRTSRTSGGTVLSRTQPTPSIVPWIAYNRPTESTVAFVVSGDATFLSSIELSGTPYATTNQPFFENAWTFATDILPCRTTPISVAQPAGGLDFSFTSGALLGVGALGASIDGVGFTLSGTLTAGDFLEGQGTSTLEFSTAATLLAEAGAVGTTTLAFTTIGASSATGALDGETSLTFTTSAAPSLLMTGTTSLTFSTIAIASFEGSLRGATELVFSTAAVGQTTIEFAGTTTLTFATVAALSGAFGIAGTTSLTFSTEGFMEAEGVFEGTTTLTFSTAGIVDGSIARSGTTDLTFSTVGAMLAVGPLAGTTTLTFSTSAITSAGAGAAGTSSLTFATSAVASSQVSISANTTMLFHPLGQLRGTSEISGNATMLFHPLAQLRASGEMSGSTSLSFATAGVASQQASVTGNTSLTISTAGALTGFADIPQVSSGLFFTVSGMLRGTGRLVGATTLTFSTAGLLSEQGPACEVCTAGLPLSKVVTLGGSITGLGCDECNTLVGQAFVLTPLGENACVLDYLDPDFPCGILNLGLVYEEDEILFFISIGALTGEARFRRATSGAPYDCDAEVDGLYELVHDVSSMCTFADMEVFVGDLGAMSGSTSLTFSLQGRMVSPCAHCNSGTTPPSMLMTLAGSSTNGTCASCVGLLGDYILTQNVGAGSECVYSFTGNVACGSLLIELTIGASGWSATIYINGTIEAIVTHTAVAPFDCSVTINMPVSIAYNQACFLSGLVVTLDPQ